MSQGEDVEKCGHGLEARQRAQAGLKPLNIPRLTFPDSNHAPAEAPQLPSVSFIANDISRPFRLPEFRVRRGHYLTIPAVVHMKEAAMDKDRDLSPRHHNVRFPREVFPM
jgi:hypothetical protein